MEQATTRTPRPISAKVKKRKQRRVTVDAQLRTLAKSIYESGMADAMKAASLVMVARKLDEVRALLVASGLGNGLASVTSPLAHSPVLPAAPAPSPPPQPSVKNPCTHCGRESMYRSRPNKFNPKGSWFCQAHMILGQSVEVEDIVDNRFNPNPPPPPPTSPPQPQAYVAPPPPQPQPGSSTIFEAMANAQPEN